MWPSVANNDNAKNSDNVRLNCFFCILNSYFLFESFFLTPFSFTPPLNAHRLHIFVLSLSSYLIFHLSPSWFPNQGLIAADIHHCWRKKRERLNLLHWLMDVRLTVILWVCVSRKSEIFVSEISFLFWCHHLLGASIRRCGKNESYLN